MEYFCVPEKSDFDKFVSYKTIEVRVMLAWHERGDFNRGDLVEVWYQSKKPGNPCFIGKIMEEKGIVEPVWEDNNYHGFMVLRQD